MIDRNTRKAIIVEVDKRDSSAGDVKRERKQSKNVSWYDVMI